MPRKPGSARQLFQFRKRRIDNAGAIVTRLVDNVVKPTVDIDQRVVARIAIIAIEIARGIFDADDIALAAANGALHRFRNDRVPYGDGIVDVGLQERQQFRTVIIRIRLVGDTAIAGVADALHRIVVADASCKANRQQQGRGISG